MAPVTRSPYDGMVAMDTSPHILVVDDDREIRDLVAKFLTARLPGDHVADGKKYGSR
jgi:hypothetical protein